MKQIRAKKEVISDVLVIKETSVILQLPGQLKPYLWTACIVGLVITIESYYCRKWIALKEKCQGGILFQLSMSLE